jgi:hypothetical protein
MEELVNYCINVRGDELTNLIYIKTWADSKTGSAFVLQKI